MGIPASDPPGTPRVGLPDHQLESETSGPGGTTSGGGTDSDGDALQCSPVDHLIEGRPWYAIPAPYPGVTFDDMELSIEGSGWASHRYGVEVCPFGTITFDSLYDASLYDAGPTFDTGNAACLKTRNGTECLSSTVGSSTLPGGERRTVENPTGSWQYYGALMAGTLHAGDAPRCGAYDANFTVSNCFHCEDDAYRTANWGQPPQTAWQQGRTTFSDMRALPQSFDWFRADLGCAGEGGYADVTLEYDASVGSVEGFAIRKSDWTVVSETDPADPVKTFRFTSDVGDQWGGVYFAVHQSSPEVQDCVPFDVHVDITCGPVGGTTGGGTTGGGTTGTSGGGTSGGSSTGTAAATSSTTGGMACEPDAFEPDGNDVFQPIPVSGGVISGVTLDAGPDPVSGTEDTDAYSVSLCEAGTLVGAIEHDELGADVGVGSAVRFIHDDPDLGLVEHTEDLAVWASGQESVANENPLAVDAEGIVYFVNLTADSCVPYEGTVDTTGCPAQGSCGDAAGQNHTRAAAYGLDANGEVLQDLRAVEGVADWFSVEVCPGGTAFLEVNTPSTSVPNATSLDAFLDGTRLSNGTGGTSLVLALPNDDLDTVEYEVAVRRSFQDGVAFRSCEPYDLQVSVDCSGGTSGTSGASSGGATSGSATSGVSAGSSAGTTGGTGTSTGGAAGTTGGSDGGATDGGATDGGTDGATDGSSGTTGDDTGLPPDDPSHVAPAIDRTIATDILGTNSFLFDPVTGVQTVPDPGVFEVARASVVRGRVLTPQGTPFAGVQIAVVGHPEYGYTVSRSDGMFDMVVNGGEFLRLEYLHVDGAAGSNWIPAQRGVDVPRLGHAVVEDVTLVQEDTAATVISLSSWPTPVQHHLATTQTDGSGERTMLLLFHEGVELEFSYGADDPRVPAPFTGDAFTVRATEFTVGEAGPSAMPANLPATSGYTYAAELSVEEALADGAVSVSFSHPNPGAVPHPVVSYLDNFLGFPVGTVVPAGAYDAGGGAWIPEPNGIVVEVVGTDAGGRAELAVDPPSPVLVPASPARLAELGITDDERLALADLSLYPVGTQLWRTPLAHFSSWDLNWGVSPDCEEPNPEDCMPEEQDEEPNLTCNEQGGQSGSIILCESQTLGERIPLVGAPFGLSYGSRSQRGYAADRSMRVRVGRANGTVPGGLVGVNAYIDVGGHHVEVGEFRRGDGSGASLLGPSGSLSPDEVIEDSTMTWTWEGEEVFGRPIQGTKYATLVVENLYPASYAQTSRFGYSRAGVGASVLGPTRAMLAFTRKTRRALRVMDARAFGLGGWDLDIHHFYDPVGKRLHRGDGSVRDADTIAPVTTTVAGGGQAGGLGPMDPIETALEGARDVAVSVSGRIYVAEPTELGAIRALDPENGVMVALPWPYPVSASASPDPAALEIGPDGLLYLADLRSHAVWRLAYEDEQTPENSIWERVAGRNRVEETGPAGDADLDGPALAAWLEGPRDIAFDTDGTLYIASGTLLRVDPAGQISSMTWATPQDNPRGARWQNFRYAAETYFYEPTSVAVDGQGNVYLATDEDEVGDQIHVNTGCGRVYRIAPDGTFSMVRGFAENSVGPAGVRDMAFDPDGNLWFAVHSEDANRSTSTIQRWDPSRFYTESTENVVNSEFVAPIAYCLPAPIDSTGGDPNGEGLIARRTRTQRVSGLAFDPEGTLLYADDGPSHRRVRTLPSSQPGFEGQGDVQLASADASEVYVFDAYGRHLRTVDAMTGVTKWTFGYDPEGRVNTVTDRFGAVTQINHTGTTIQIVSPDGLQTDLTLDDNGYLESVSNPASETYQIGYNEGGLVETFTNPRGNTSVYGYDELGRLVSARSAAAPGETPPAKTLERTEIPGGTEVRFTSAEGRQTTYRVTESNNVISRTVISPDGTEESQTILSDRAGSRVGPDGSTVEETVRADPRFGAQAPLRGGVAHTPAGRTLEMSRSRELLGADSADLTSFETLAEVRTVNGSNWLSVFDRSTSVLQDESPEGRTVVRELNALGQASRIQVGDLAPVEFGYDERGRLISTTQNDGVTTRSMGIVYDANGFVGSVTDSLGRVTGFEYDLAGRVTKQVLPDLREILFSYDANGNLERLTPPSRPAHGFTYDATDRVTTYDPPVLPEVPEPTTTYTYNDDHQVEVITRPDGQEITSVYETASGRLMQVIVPSGSYGITYLPSGQVETLVAPSGTMLSYAYDGRLVQSETMTGEVAGAVSVTHDDDLDAVTESVNGGHTVSYARDGDGTLVQAGDETLSPDPITGHIGGTSVGSITSSINRNGFGEVDRLTYTFDGDPVIDVQLSRDEVGRIQTRGETVQGTTTLRCYDYDLQGRLIAVRDGFDAGAGSCAGALVEEYRYDDNSNRVYGFNSAGLVDESQVLVDDQDRLAEYGGLRYSYEASGSLVLREDTATGDVWEFDYDVMGNLTRVQLPNSDVVEYVVDGRDRRVGKKVNGVLVQGFLYGNQANPIAELDGSGSVVARFVYGSRGHVPDYMVKEGATYRLLTDYVGSVLAVVDVLTGDIVQRLEYDAWGRVLVDTNPGFQPFGFAGGIWDSDVGLVRFGARDYDPESGRWTAKDPLGLTLLSRGEGADPATTPTAGGPFEAVGMTGPEFWFSTAQVFASGAANLYLYGLGDPIGSADWTGKKPGDPFKNPHDAAKDFCQTYGPDTFAGGAEQYTGIYMVCLPTRPVPICYWTYREPTPGRKRDVSPMPLPEDRTACHTHPMDSPGPSPEDVQNCNFVVCAICYGDEPRWYQGTP